MTERQRDTIAAQTNACTLSRHKRSAERPKQTLRAQHDDQQEHHEYRGILQLRLRATSEEHCCTKTYGEAAPECAEDAAHAAEHHAREYMMMT